MPASLSLARPQRLASSRRCRLGMRLAAGFPTSTVARAEGVPEAEVASLLAEPDFADLVAAYRDLASLPREERVAHLAKLAWHVLELALADGDVRAAIFVAATVRAGRDPAEALAEAVVAAVERAAEPPPPVPPRLRDPPTALRDPAPGIVAGAATRACNLLAAEHEALAPRRPLTRRPPVPKPRGWRTRQRRRSWLWRNRRRSAAVAAPPRREAPS